MSPQPDERNFWQEWGATKQQIEEIHKSIFSTPDGLVKRVYRLEQMVGRVIVFCFLMSAAGAATTTHFLTGNKNWISSAIAVASSVCAIIYNGWGGTKSQ